MHVKPQKEPVIELSEQHIAGILLSIAALCVIGILVVVYFTY